MSAAFTGFVRNVLQLHCNQTWFNMARVCDCVYLL